MDIVIVGAGKLGTGLAKRLSEEEHNVTIVEIDSRRTERLVEKLDVQGVCGSGTHIEALNEAGVPDADLLISATSSDENNILTCLIAKKLGVKHTIARVRNPEYNVQFDFMRDQLGISMMVNPDFAAALEIGRILQFPYAVGIESFANGFIDIVEFKVSEASPLAGNEISGILSSHKIKMLICAVERGDDVFIPNGDFVLKPDDKVYVTGEHKALFGIAKVLVGTKIRPLKNIMIIGASRATTYLSQILTDMGKNVIVVEKNRDECKALLSMVQGITVINGDANDHDLLIENNIENMDAVVTLTNTDEINFLVSLYAKKIGVEKTITKINNLDFQKMLDDLGLDSRVNVSEITVDMITQYVRAKKDANSSYMKTLYKLVDGKVEAIEFVAGEKTRFLNKPLSQIKFKKNVLIAAIKRNNTTLFPSGGDSILAGDTVIVVSKDRIIESLNDIIQ